MHGAAERAPAASGDDRGRAARDCDGRGQSPAWSSRVRRDLLETMLLESAQNDAAEARLRPCRCITAIANLSVKSMFPGGSYDAERTIAVILAGRQPL